VAFVNTARCLNLFTLDFRIYRRGRRTRANQASKHFSYVKNLKQEHVHCSLRSFLLSNYKRFAKYNVEKNLCRRQEKRLRSTEARGIELSEDLELSSRRVKELQKALNGCMSSQQSQLDDYTDSEDTENVDDIDV
jgi:hypothetical protein